MPLFARRSHASRDAGATRRDIIVGVAAAAVVAAIAVPVISLSTAPAAAPSASASPAAGLSAASFTKEWTAAGYSVTQGTGDDEDFLIARDQNGTEKARLKHVVSAPLVVTTLLGGNTGFVDGPIATAGMSVARDTATGPDGTIYFTDTSRNAVRKITPDGTVVTIAGGDPVGGFADGTRSLAKFNGPAGLAVDAAGNVYVADEYNHAVRKITTAGFVTTVAGTGTPGYTDGVTPSFSHPSSVAVAADGTVYVADTMNFAIRAIGLDRVVRTVAGSQQGHRDGTGTAARFSYPQGIALDSAGNLYVADPVDHTIRKVSPTGAVTTYAGNPTAGRSDGPALSATFTHPTHVTVDAAGTVYVSDHGTQTIRRIAAGTVTTYAGTGTAGNRSGPAASATFTNPAGIAARPDGSLIVADTGNSLLRLIHR